MGWATVYVTVRKKSVPQKKFQETDAIFEQLASVHEQRRVRITACLRLSIDAKARGQKSALFSRQWAEPPLSSTRLTTILTAQESLTPFGIFLAGL